MTLQHKQYADMIKSLVDENQEGNCSLHFIIQKQRKDGKGACFTCQ